MATQECVWTRCSCGHIAQDHNSRLECEAQHPEHKGARCACTRYDGAKIEQYAQQRLDGTLKCFIQALLNHEVMFGDFHMSEADASAIAGGLFFAFNRDSDLAGIAIKYGVNTVNENGRFRA